MRTRTRITSHQQGEFSRKIFGNYVIQEFPVNQDKKVCIDELHKGYPFVEQGPLEINYVDRGKIEPVNGGPVTDGFGFSTTFAKNVIPDVVRLNAWDHIALPDMPAASVDAAKVLARTNPNRNDSNWTENITSGGLGNPAKLIKETGDQVYDLANGHLLWSFGIAPLIDDLKKLLEIQERMKQRLKEFDSLFKKGGLRRKVNLGTYTATSGPSDIVLHSNVFAVTASLQAVTTARRWGVVRWQADGWSLGDYTDEEMYYKVRRLLTGTDISPQTLWKALPWTWLIGWFTNVGLLMDGARNNFPVRPGQVAIMTHTETEFTFSNVARSDWISGGGGSLKRITKLRQIVPSGGLPLSFLPSPGFSGWKSSILGSLAIQRLGRL